MFQTDNHFFQTVTEGITDGNRSTKIQYRVCWIESTNTGYVHMRQIEEKKGVISHVDTAVKLKHKHTDIHQFNGHFPRHLVVAVWKVVMLHLTLSQPGSVDW